MSVQTDQQCVDAVTGRDGVLDGARRGTCVAVLSTVLPMTIESLAALASERAVDLVDTPLAGRGMFSVEQGTMSVLVGDDGSLVERLRPHTAALRLQDRSGGSARQRRGRSSSRTTSSSTPASPP